MWVALDFGAIPELVQGMGVWFGSLAAVAGAISGYVAVFRASRKKAMAKGASEPPTALPAPPLVPAHPFASAETTGRFLEAHAAVVMRGEWALSEIRDELRQAREERDEMAGDARRTAAALVRVETEKRSAEAKLATLEQTAEHWRAEAARLERVVELLRARQRSERVDPETLRTPLRPPAKPRGA